MIGTTADGTAPLGNFSDGVAILDSPGNLIGGTVAGAGNIIAGNTGNGVHLSGSSTTGNVLWGNFIGTNSERWRSARQLRATASSSTTMPRTT